MTLLSALWFLSLHTTDILQLGHFAGGSGGLWDVE